MVLLVVVLSNGAIERHDEPRRRRRRRPTRAGPCLDADLAGRTWGTVPDVVTTNDPEVDAIVADLTPLGRARLRPACGCTSGA
jgi:hypothetical protein